uniref:NADP-dependent oxidoreductase domain-containing protein n=1 Tax=Branchiostoma floridae TaxID=7739 RepID=C3YF07_BRAFL|eukprot:XP_002605241.1 hypothetical protein BRAFLDRAFT_126594 [Branchiostoma floridae]
MKRPLELGNVQVLSDEHNSRTLSALNDLVRVGKVRYLGASNVKGWQLQKIVELSKSMGLNKWISLQAEYSLLCRGIEWELTDVCRREGIGIIPWSPLRGGLLTGKFKREADAPEGTRIEHVTKKGMIFEGVPDFKKVKKDDKTWDILDVLKKVADAHGKTPAQVAIRWLLQKDVVSSVIIGAKTLQQLEDNMGAATGWEITEETMAELDTVSQMDAFYPYNMIKRRNKDRVIMDVARSTQCPPDTSAGRRSSAAKAGVDMADKTEYRFLGGSGLKVSNICLGTLTFGNWALFPGQCDEAASHAIQLDRYVELGGNFIDTADIYAEGRFEETIGSWLEK